LHERRKERKDTVEEESKAVEELGRSLEIWV
jgi:hypothetical protein